jgi:hypothetical protein
MEWSAPSRTEKGMAGGAGVGIVEARTPNDRNRKSGLHRPLRTSAHKEGEVETRKKQDETPSPEKKTLQAQTSEEKERRYTGLPLHSFLLKEEAVWWNA